MVAQRKGAGFPRLAVHGLPSDDSEARAADLVRMGFDTVVVQMEESVVAAAVAAKLNVFVCTGSFTVRPGPDRELLAVDVYGDRRVWFGSGCPNHPELRERHIERIKRALAWRGVGGFYLDGIRFASPAPGLKAFLTCFCDDCARQAKAAKFDFEAMRRDVRAFGELILGRVDGLERLAHPVSLASVLSEMRGVADWLSFRARCIESYVADLSRVVVDLPGRKRLAAYLFTPAFAALVGQRYQRLAPHLDVVSPMIYRTWGGDSVLNNEIDAIASWPEAGTPLDRSRAVRASLGFCGLEGLTGVRSLAGLRKPFLPKVVGDQAALAAKASGVGGKLAPIIRLVDDRLPETVRLVMAAGATGVNFFSYEAGTEAYLQSAAALAR